MDLEILKLDGDNGYGPKAIPSERDGKIEALIRESLGSSQVDELTSGIGVDHQSVLVVFGERMASLAVRRRDADLLRIGLVGLVLGGLAQGSREVLMRLPLYHHAAQELLGGSESLFRSVGKLVASPIDAALEKFLARSDEDKSLECMGYRIGSDEDGFRYTRDW